MDIKELRALLDTAIGKHECYEPAECYTCRLLGALPALLDVAEAASERLDHLRDLRVDVQTEKLTKHEIVDILSDEVCELAMALKRLEDA